MIDSYILILYDNYIYKIDKEPFESDENTYKRGWYIIKNQDKYEYPELITRSIIYLSQPVS